MTSFYYKLFLCNLEFFFLMCDIIIDNMDVSCSKFLVLYFIITTLLFVSISYSLIFTNHLTSPYLPHLIPSILFIMLL